MEKLKSENLRRVSAQSDISEISESGTKARIKYGGPLAAAWGLFADFSNNSTVHGVKYLGEKRRHWVERAFWIIAFIVSLVGCLILINKIYVKWQESPVIVSFAEKSTPVWEIPFPAVTICPETKVLKRHVDFTAGYKGAMSGNYSSNFTDEKQKVLEAIAQVCDLHLFAMQNVSIDSGLKPEEIVPTLRASAVPLNESILFCKWRNSVRSCDEYFTEILTEEGFCYTFNVLDSSQLFKEEV